MTLGVVTFGLILAALVGVFLYLRRNARTRSGEAQLSAFLTTGLDYRIVVGVPLYNPTEWVPVSECADGLVILSNGEQVRCSEVTSFIVAYPSGEMVETRNPSALPVPDWVSTLEFQERTEDITLSFATYERSRGSLEVTIDRSLTHPDDANYLSTTLRNTRDVPIKVTKFGAFVQRDQRLVLHTVTNNFFTAQQFREWYGVDLDGWIKPGQEVTDPSNYGGRGCYWVYYCKAQTGEEFLASGAW